MAGRAVAEENGVITALSPRLCSEIQLFDLCDRESCSCRDGRYCSNTELLSAFERISDEVIARPEVYGCEDSEDGEDFGDGEHDDGFDEGFAEDEEPEDEY